MIIKTYLLAFREFELREVEVPNPSGDTKELLNQVFHNGQNDFCPKDQPSLSVGDIIELNDYYMIAPVGFKKISVEKLEEHKKLPMLERIINSYKL